MLLNLSDYFDIHSPNYYYRDDFEQFDEKIAKNSEQKEGEGDQKKGVDGSGTDQEEAECHPGGHPEPVVGEGNFQLVTARAQHRQPKAWGNDQST